MLEKGGLYGYVFSIYCLFIRGVLIAAVLVLISLSKEHKGSFSGAGWLLIIVRILGAICTLYYSMHYYNFGDFAHAYPQLMIPEKKA